ncbi:MAG: trehalose-phosphatase [Thermoplasmataceae archaeon]|jgi:trehalose 6-phosphate phosphatase
MPLDSDLIREARGLPRGSPIFLDYDGTLVPLSTDPETTFPDDDVLWIMDRLSGKYQVYVATGRSIPEITRFLDSRYNFIALHGAILKPKDGQPEYVTDAGEYIRKCDAIYAGRDDFFRRYPGLKMTNKQGGLVFIMWGLDEKAMSSLVEEVSMFASQTGMDLYRGKRIVELRIPGVNKGITIRRVRNGAPALIAGDDATDEDSFLDNPDAITVKVGDGDTAARFRVRDVAEFRVLLKAMSES